MPKTIISMRSYKKINNNNGDNIVKKKTCVYCSTCRSPKGPEGCNGLPQFKLIT